jgi:hypothetical protein
MTWTDPPPAPKTSPSREQTRWLATATLLSLNCITRSPAAESLVSVLATEVARQEAPSRRIKHKHEPVGMQKLRLAVAAISAGVLRPWARRTPAPVYRSMSRDSFSGGRVPFTQFVAITDALLALGYLVKVGVCQWGTDWQDGNGAIFGKGLAARFWPTAALLRVAERHGVTPATIKGDFTKVTPTATPKVPDDFLEVRALKLPGNTRRKDGESLGDVLRRAAARHIRRAIAQANAFAASHDVQGCAPPRWKRTFAESLNLGGRWCDLWGNRGYQNMGAKERLAIVINGQSVAEVDVKASYLTIMHGLLGLPQPDGDPYDLPGAPPVDRDAVKTWILATIGKGSPIRKWSAETARKNPGCGRYDAKQLGDAIISRYPFLALDARTLVEGLHLDGRLLVASPKDRSVSLEAPEKALPLSRALLVHRLVAIEAAAITGVMIYLRKMHRVLALPMHNGIIVPQSALSIVRPVFDDAFIHFAKVRPQLTQATLDDGKVVEMPL